MNKRNINNQKAILILAGKVNLPNYNFKSHEYLFNIGNSLAFQKIKKELDIDENTNIYIAISKINNKFIKFIPFKNAKFIEVGNTNAVLDSISIALKKIPEKIISINPITTIPEFSEINNKTCYFGSKKIPKENWSAILKLNDNKYHFLFKNDNNYYGLNSYPFTGRLVAEKIHLEDCLENIKKNKKSDILSVVEILIKKYNYKIIFEKWFDIGHEATYIDSKLNSMTSRFFNNIIFLEERNTILKSSSDLQKIRGEYFFYKNLNKNLRNFFPYIYSENNLEDKFNSIEMEFVPYPNLAEIFLFRNIGPNSWIRIISSIKKIYKSFYAKKNIKVVKDASWLYSLKLESRFKETVNYIERSNNITLKKLLNDGVYVNEIFNTGNLYEIFQNLKNDLVFYEKNINHYVGHGDLCFNNILVDYKSGSTKLIDPKAFMHEEENIIGLIDPNYDLAKLNHSYKYLYDSIVNDLYSIEVINSKVELFIYAPKEYELVNLLFNDILIGNNIEEDILRIITSSLFLSMLPLHIDNENRLLCLAILGSIAFNNIDLRKFIIQI
ncbi:hypothetical protein OA176_01260 [Prochlorococcus sp. AH-716-P13]|nr:hypothetical protein [Prochlorococcus sp. AH-716-P13]